MAQRGSRPGERRGGRKKGTPNKRTVLFQSVKESINRKGCNPADLIADGALGKLRGRNVDMRLRAAMELLKYVAPQMMRTEHVGADGGPIRHGPVQIVIDYGDAVPTEDAAASQQPSDGEE